MIAISSPRSKKRARIEIIPLIDIIFFLLATFVMVSLSMVRNSGIAVNLPKAATAAPQERSETNTISLDAQGGVYFNKEPVNNEALNTALKVLLARDNDPRVVINGDVKAEFGTAIAVLDQARKLGITKIAIQTEPLPATPAK
ncbi:MAG: ExbD/TolR family protein [Chthoniobacteraceae bacterium]